MEQENSFYIQKLKEELSLRQRNNPRYSLRSFARDLDIHSSTLSQVINNKRNLPFKKAQSVVDALDLNPIERTMFLNSFYKTKTKIDEIEIVNLTDSHIVANSCYKVLAEWEHFAVLELFDLNAFEVTIESIQKKLDVTKTRAEVVLKNLIDAELLSYDSESGQYSKTHENISTTEDQSSKALRKSHQEMLAMASQKIEEIPLEFRDYSSVNVSVDQSKMPEAKSIIREFRKKMMALLRDGEKKDVYQLSIQFFPLSVLEELENE